jgi:hypothetical protein
MDNEVWGVRFDGPCRSRRTNDMREVRTLQKVSAVSFVILWGWKGSTNKTQRGHRGEERRTRVAVGL